MSDFVESAKNFVSNAVSRTGWEAQKQMRTRNKQAEIDKLLTQRRELMDELSLHIMNLYQQGTLTDQQLSRLCASVLELDADVRSRETQLQEIKKENYPAEQFAAGKTPDYTPPPSPAPSSSSTPPSSTAGYSGTQGAGAAGTQETHCPNCGNTLRPNALYCRSCGAKMR